uniref:Centrosomal protein of 70 kDa n=1 Tax=Heterorhabditis bacteriophora TaxID=37862 RepID=A0A1I7WTV6_HETBA
MLHRNRFNNGQESKNRFQVRATSMEYRQRLEALQKLKPLVIAIEKYLDQLNICLNNGENYVSSQDSLVQEKYICFKILEKLKAILENIKHELEHETLKRKDISSDKLNELLSTTKSTEEQLESLDLIMDDMAPLTVPRIEIQSLYKILEDVKHILDYLNMTSQQASLEKIPLNDAVDEARLAKTKKGKGKTQKSADDGVVMENVESLREKLIRLKDNIMPKVCDLLRETALPDE